MRTLCVACAMALGAALLPVGPAHADNAPTTVAGLIAHYVDLSHQAEKVNEQLLKAQEQAQTLRQRADKANTAFQAADASWKQAVRQADQLVADRKQRAALLRSLVPANSVAAVLNSASADDFTSASIAAGLAHDADDAVAAATAQTLAQTSKAREAAEQQQAAATKAATAATDLENQVTAQRADMDKQVSQVRAALNALPPDEVTMLQTGISAPNITTPAGAVGTALRFALAQLGKPYEWGGVGPLAYDCSGLVQAAYRAAGIGLPRVAADQAQVGQPVSRADVRAGDLIYFYQPVQHVALALDHNQAVQAATFGEPIKISPIDAIGPITVIRRLVTP
ncbi:NlpC/P60 family protein [Kutzneria sp. CA-103260]|uniref:NlpC/P60 family protein n=1 Tax=Kutzneria sp. CA-103260 TaxID=2802641 RepID=UPI001BA9149D|nr:NlpC/P60 family protein [Kutzneria sp. CA-103260]QUQ63893.1 NLP/P60-family protein [Kutzneria sp. CA-103260]